MRALHPSYSTPTTPSQVTMPYETCEGVVGHIRELGCVKYQLC